MMKTLLPYTSILLSLFIFSACAHLPESRHWRQASTEAFKDPYTWVPLGAAALVAISNQDKAMSREAIRESPVFGSNQSADEASDDLRSVTSVLKNVSALMVAPDCDSFNHPVSRMLVQQGVVIGAHGMVDQIKEATHRQRPNNSNNYSFPSGHATKAFSYHAFTRENLKCSDYSETVNMSIRWVSEIAAIGTAYARVEAGAHYPVDVLAGAGFGNFVSMSFSKALREKHNEQNDINVNLLPMGNGVVFQLSKSY